MNDESVYRLRWRGRETGPFTVAEINRRLDEHEIGMGHEILFGDEWITVEQFLASIEELEELPIPPALPQFQADSSPSLLVARVRGVTAKRRMIFALTGVVAGFTGAHNFYARHWLTGLLQLLLSMATFLLGFGIIASWLWAMAEAIFVRKDGEGIEMI